MAMRVAERKCQVLWANRINVIGVMKRMLELLYGTKTRQGEGRNPPLSAPLALDFLCRAHQCVRFRCLEAFDDEVDPQRKLP